ncbi:MAG: ribosome assembly RNA-binding protein YhbY [Lachnospiraceae bacterium]|nr:ribosome assembly RNA-binding protein YhbY [Lachnospiraceae bacterium]
MLTSKQRAYLRKLAQNMDPVFQIGKEGVTPEVIKAVDDVLEARELIKLNILKSVEEDVREVADTIALRTHSECCQMIGRRIVLYRRAEKPKLELPR